MKVFVLVFENVDDMIDYPINPRVYSNREKAVNALYCAYESASMEYPQDYIRDCSEEEYIIYEDGRYSENRWVGRMYEVEIDEE